ncbi:hypothetical protein OGAPHI_000087 [Ogataea philodendri]|uniref:Major facilitator superfamily (MFS) profile domain-containing protein n=1 Tax=Ogataea philodendri TaxID=1378263 RepID=A0A9P8TB89_9ASCO|nr:uncharacterized protein OGAPHI_000087 [Ogataea philodendri]KAH3671901.1 hypothetical protein OGAPHI_000087 [Ogataea philodendri]
MSLDASGSWLDADTRHYQPTEDTSKMSEVRNMSTTDFEQSAQPSVEDEKQVVSANGADLERQRNWSSVMAVYVGLLMAIGGFLYGYDTGIINGLLDMEYVRTTFPPHGEMHFTASQNSLITSVLSIGTFVGSLLAPIFSDRIGRRLSIFSACTIMFSLGTILQVVSSTIPLLCVGRLISGFGVGMISAIIPLYQAEVSPKWIRGSVVSLYQWAITWGLLVSSAITQATHSINDARCYRIPIGLQLIWGVFLAVGMYSLPESPRFYVKKDRLDDALHSLSRFRRLEINDKSLIEELIEIKASHDYEMSFGKTSILDCFRSSPSRANQLRRMMIGMVLQALQQCSGINFIFYYGVNFFVHAGVANSYLISFVTYTVNVVFTIPGIFFVEIWGRRPLLIVGAAGMTVSNFVIGIVGITTDSIIANKIMVAFVCLFIAFFASTWGPLAWVVVGEMYSLSIRQKAVSITAATNWLVNFVFAFSTPYLVDTGKHTAALGTKIFFLWGSLNFVGLVFAYFNIYETKGLLLEEVDDLFRFCKNARQSRYYRPHQNNIESEGSHPSEEERPQQTNAHMMINDILSVPNNVPPSIHSTDDEIESQPPNLDHYFTSQNEYNYSNQEDLMGLIRSLGMRISDEHETEPEPLAGSSQSVHTH